MALTPAERQRRSRERKAKVEAAVQARLSSVAGPQQPALFGTEAGAGKPDSGAAGAKWRAYCLAQFGSTLVAQHRMAAWAAGMSLSELAAALGCDRLTAWRELRAALADVTPFLHARAPLDPGEAQTPTLQVVFAPGLVAALDAEDARATVSIGTGVARDAG